MRFLALIALVACSAGQEPSPCSPADYAELSATCGDNELECNRKIEDRESLCAERIREGK